MTADTGENGAPTLLTFFNKEGKRSRVKRSPDEMSRASRGADTCVSGLTMGQQSYAADLMNQKTTRDDQRKQEAMEDAFEILKEKEIEQGLSKEESQQLFVQIFQQLLEENKAKYEEEDRIQDQRFKDAFDSLVEERTRKKPPAKSLFRGGASSSSPESPSASSTTDHFCKPMLSPSPQRRSSPAKVIQAPEAPNSPASIGTADIFAAFTLPIANPPLETDNKNASSASKEEKEVRRGKKQKPTTKVVRRVRRVKLKKNTEDIITDRRDEVEEKKSHPVQQQKEESAPMKVEPSRTISSDTLNAVKNYSSKQLVVDDGLLTQKNTDDPNLSKSKMSKNDGLAMRNPKKNVITKKKPKIQTTKDDVRKVMERIMSSETLPTAPLSESLSTAGEEEEEPSPIEEKPSKNDTAAKIKKKKSRTHNKEGKSRSKTKEPSSKSKSKGGSKDKQSTTTQKTPASISTDPQKHQDETKNREGKRATEKPKRRKPSSSKDRLSSTKDSSNAASSKIRKKKSSSSSTKKTKELDTTGESKRSKRRSSSGKKSSTHQRRRQRSKDEIADSKPLRS